MQLTCHFDGRMFPILASQREVLHGPRSIPWCIVAPFEARARTSHGQTLERLAERGGLSPRELLLVLTDRPLRDFDYKMDEQDALDAVVELIESYKRRPIE